MYRLQRARILLSLAAFGGALLFAGCSDSTGSGAKDVSLSFTTRSATSVRTSAGLSEDVSVGSQGELVLKRIQLVLDHVELSPSAGTVCDDGDESGDDNAHANDDGRDDDCEDFARDPILVDVPVDDAIHTVLSVPVAAGTFTRFEARLDPVGATSVGAPVDMVGKSVRVEGTFRGVPFVFTSPLRSSLEFEFNPPLVIDQNGKNATVSIDVARWFIAANGSVIDPATASSGANAQIVAENIRRSFEAFEDDDRGGDDDHGAEHEGESGHHG